MRSVLVLLLAGAAACSSSAHCRQARDGEIFPHGASVVIDGNAFEVEVADEGAEQQTGLMGRTSLRDDQGMLFAWSDTRTRTFWMKDTLIALDLIAISDERVVSIDTMSPCEADPCPYTTTSEAQFALEIRGGLARDLGIQVGDFAAVREDTCL